MIFARQGAMRCLPLMAFLFVCTMAGTTLPAVAQLLPSSPGAAPASPANAPAASAALTESERQDAEKLLRTLSDPTQRDQFLSNLRGLLRAVPAASTDAEGAEVRSDWLSQATQSLASLSTGVLSVIGEMEQIPEQLNAVAETLTDPFTLQRLAWTVVTVLGVLAGALLAEWITIRLLAAPRRAVEARQSRSWLVRALLLVVRTILDVLPIAAFALVAFGILGFAEVGFVVRLAVVSVLHANVMARLINAAGRAVLAPRTPALRLVALDDEGATYSYLWWRRFTTVAVYGYFLVRTGWILGLSQSAFVFLGNLLGLLIAGMAIVFVLQVRAPVARVLRGARDETTTFRRLRRHLSDFWHLLAIAYVAAIYAVWVLEIPGGFAYLARASVLSVLVVVAARLAYLGLARVLGTIFKLSAETRVQFPLLEARANRYLPFLRRAGQILLAALVALVLVEIWGGQPFEWLGSLRGQAVLGRLVSISIVMLAGLVVWELGSVFAERLANRRPASTRLKTLLPFLQNALRIVLLTLVGLIILSEIGVNIAPLLAGAGVLGLAVGFGAQTLVKDVITGVFILMEDTISVGDVVELGTHGGLVEKITIRTLHLRDFDGNVHSMPFSEVQTVKNMSKQFAYAVVDVRVAYRESIDEALGVMAEVAQDMATKGPLAESIVAPFEVVGVEALEESGVWLRGRFKTRPLGQWNVRREFYRRIKGAFDARGIEIPFPHTTLYMGVDKKGNAPALHVTQGEMEPARPAPAKRRAALEEARTPGPIIEEHPGAKERQGEDALLPALEENPR